MIGIKRFVIMFAVLSQLQFAITLHGAAVLFLLAPTETGD